MRRELLCCCMLLWLWLAGPAAAATPHAAITLDRVGDAVVVIDQQATRLNLLDYLPVGSQLRLSAGARVSLVFLNSSTEWVFVGPGRYRLSAESPSTLEGTSPTKGGAAAPPSDTERRFDPARRERMILGASVTRSGALLRIVGPDLVEVLGNPPTLVWKSARRQKVRVAVLQAATMASVAQAEVDGERWTLPAPLPPGDYVWHIGEGADGVVRGPVARFKVVDAAGARYRSLLRRPQSFAQRLALALELEAEGLSHDALLMLSTLAAERPDEPALDPWRH